MEKEEYQELRNKNIELISQLKKRNEEYIYKLQKQLEGKVDKETQEEALSKILPKLIEGQKTGQTAVKLFGSVSDCAKNIIEEPKKEKNNEPLKPWQAWLDNSLILFVVLAGVSAVMLLFPSKNNVTAESMARISSLLISAMAGGLVFYFFNKYIYQYTLPGADKSKKPSFMKQMGIMAIGIIAWMFIMQVAMFLPKQINPAMPSGVLIILAIVAYGIRYYMRKKYHYTSSMFSFTQQSTDE